ncbi:MAG: hypothetical protein CM15mP58_10810 [Burkholderiaceae bacterium]|nr:MAG: hypothetical protein CM15mP58_10810 [Burkholderiaceae bacterium]
MFLHLVISPQYFLIICKSIFLLKNEKKVIIYLHGFRSSPESKKATFLKQFCSTNNIDFLCPPLDLSPEKAAEQAITIVKNIIGDSESADYFSRLFSRWILRNLYHAKL